MMKGWVTWTAVLGLVATQFAKVYLGADMDMAEEAATGIFQAIDAVWVALGFVGIGRKVEKRQIKD